MPYTDNYDPNYAPQSYGKIEMNMGGYYKGLTLEWYVLSQNVLENYTTVQYTVTVSKNVPENYLRTNGATRVQLEVNFAVIKEFYFTTPGDYGTITYDLYHNGYGQHEMGVSLYYYNFGGGQSSGATVIHNYDLPRISQGAYIFSAPAAFNDEDNPVITYRAFQNVADAVITTNTNLEELDIVVSHPLAAASEETPYTMMLTEEERDELRLRCKSSKSMKLFIGTYSNVDGNKLFDFKETIFSVINADPTATGTVKDINPVTLALTGDENTLIRFVSTAAVSAQFTAIKKAAIAGYWIEHNSNIFPETYHEFEKVEGNIFGFHITDSRGNIGESFVQSPMIEYIKLTCNIDTTEKPGTDGVMDLKCSGNFFNDTFGYTSAATKNTLKVQYRYKQHGFNTTYTEWADMPFTINDDNTYDAAIILEGFDYQDTYVFQCRAIDTLSDVLTVEYIAKSLPVFHWGEKDFVFEVPVTFNSSTSGIQFPAPPPDYTYGGSMDGDLNMTGDLTAGGNVFLPGEARGIYFGEESDSYIAADEDNHLHISTSILNVDGSFWIQGNPVEYGEWFPTISDGAAESYTTNYGWYQRIGKAVTAGFFIKVNCKTGYHTTPVTIHGLPFQPICTAAGGGMCSGAKINAGFAFQCWALNENGKINSRVQACNATVDQPLPTSASGLFYPQNGGEITLSGTISFMLE